MKTIDRIFAGFLVLLFASPAFAYIDPGSGSLLLQFLIAGAVGLFFKVRIYFAGLLLRLKRMFKR